MCLQSWRRAPGWWRGGWPCRRADFAPPHLPETPPHPLTLQHWAYQRQAPGGHHPSPPLYRLLLAPLGLAWTCSPWEPTGRRAQWCQTEPPRRRWLLVLRLVVVWWEHCVHPTLLHELIGTRGFHTSQDLLVMRVVPDRIATRSWSGAFHLRDQTESEAHQPPGENGWPGQNHRGVVPPEWERWEPSCHPHRRSAESLPAAQQ